MYYQKKEHDFNIATKKLREGIEKDVILIEGEEEYLIKWYVNSLKKKYISAGFEEIDYIEIDAASRSEIDIISSIDSYSMMSEKKVIWIKDSKLLTDADYTKSHKEEVELILTNAKLENPGVMIVLSIAKIDKRIKWIKDIKEIVPVYTFGKLERNDLSSFIEKKIRQSSLKIDRSTLNDLIEMTGYYTKESDYNLFQLENDIKKLVAYAMSNSTKRPTPISITSVDLEETILGYENKYIFNLINSIYSKDRTKVIELLHNMRGVKMTNIVSGLIANIEFILKLKELTNEKRSREEMKNILKVADGRIDANAKYLVNLEITKIQKLLVMLYDIEYKMKSGKMDAMLGLQIFACKL